jgi:release factor glutamine methyltransferase
MHPEVYEPAEDTFLLVDALDVKSDDSVFEIGTGSGLIGLYCASIGCDVICSDINPIAVELVKKNLLMNKERIIGSFEVRLGDMFSVLNIGDEFDIVVFNPPYLPTSKEEKVGGWFDKAVDGGVNGLDLTTRFIEVLSNYVKKDGKAYFVFSSLSDQEKLENVLDKNDFEFEIKKSCKFNNEELMIYCIYKK